MLLSREKKVAKLCDDKGYTLLELLVVLVILTLIIGIAGPMVLRQFGTAKSNTASVEVNRLMTNLQFYKVDVGSFPTDEQGLDALLSSPDGENTWQGPYVGKESQLYDPWGNKYLYRSSSDGDTAEVYSLGADGVEGGDGEDADISSND